MEDFLDLYDLSLKERLDLETYFQPRFLKWHNVEKQSDLYDWTPILTMSKKNAEEAIWTYLLKGKNPISFQDNQALKIEIYPSFAGAIPIIYTNNVADFELLLTSFINTTKIISHIDEIGAAFIYGKNNHFLLLSSKPYSGVDASQTEFSKKQWLEKSMIIRREHECTHYYTKLHYQTSKNHIHDELIADFNGMMAAMNHYSSQYFLKFMGLEDRDCQKGRLKVYTQSLSQKETLVIGDLLILCAKNLEKWSQSQQCQTMDVAMRTQLLCQQDLFEMALYGVQDKPIFKEV